MSARNSHRTVAPRFATEDVLGPWLAENRGAPGDLPADILDQLDL